MSTSEIIWLLVQVIGSLALFLFGMKYMSEALQRFAGQGMRNVLASFTSNRFKSILTGAFVTTVIQSSSATTVMVVSFVNAGILKLRNAIGVIMGANIGTTMTAWIITLFGLKFDISAFAIPVIGAGFICMMLNNIKINQVGEFFVGFGILFLGLTFLKNTINDLDLQNSEAVRNIIASCVSDGNAHIGHVLLFLLIGTILTTILQSSSATMALTIVLCSEGVIPLELAVALVLGENIGTTITANIAAAIGNSTAKRAARAHFLFNTIGVIWILVVFRLVMPFINFLTISIEGVSPYVSAAAVPVALSLFHTLFNIMNTSILVWFVPQIEKLTSLMVQGGSDEDEVEYRLKYINTGFMNVGEVSIELAKKEIGEFAKRMVRMYNFIPDLMKMKQNSKEYKPLLSRVQHYEEISDRMEIEIADYLDKIRSESISGDSSLRMRGMLRIVDNLESIGDQNYQLAKMIDDRNKAGVHFSEEMEKNLSGIFELVGQALEIMMKNLELAYNNVEIAEALEVETQINQYRDRLRVKHLEDIDNKVYRYSDGIYYSGIYSILEKLGDHIINVTESIVNAKHTTDKSLV
jgi:phosphate:Na+ symporter